MTCEPKEAASPDQEQRSWIRHVDPDGFTKVAAAIAVLLYVVGLVAVNEYLVVYGASDFTLFRSRFVYTGALVLVPLALFPTGVVLFRAFLQERSIHVRSWPIPKLILWVLGSAAIAVCVWAIFFFVFAEWAPGSRVDAARHALTLVCGPAVLTFAAWGCAHSWLRFRQRRPLARLGRHQIFLLATVVLGAASVLAFSYYSGKFVDDVYPIVPAQFGGGLPTPASIVLTEEGTAALRSLLGDSPSGSPFDVEVIFEGDDYYIIDLLSTQAQTTVPVFRIPKNLVEVIRTQAPRR